MDPIAELKESVDSLRKNAEGSEQILVVDCLDGIVKVLGAQQHRLGNIDQQVKILLDLAPRAS